jgi:hypothetical protein
VSTRRAWARPGLALAALLTILLAAMPLPAAAQDLEETLGRVAAAWHRGDVGSLTGLGSRAGISIDVDGRSVGPLGARQAAPVIRRVFEERESVNIRSNMARRVGGSPARAFGEITWTTRARGTTIPERATLFVAFVLEDERWRITEIRLMR